MKNKETHHDNNNETTPPLRIRPPQNKIEGKVGSETMTKMIPHITSRTLPLRKAKFLLFFVFFFEYKIDGKARGPGTSNCTSFFLFFLRFLLDHAYMDGFLQASLILFFLFYHVNDIISS